MFSVHVIQILCAQLIGCSHPQQRVFFFFFRLPFHPVFALHFFYETIYFLLLSTEYNTTFSKRSIPLQPPVPKTTSFKFVT
ncbi:hypothetical protein V8B55DRAFT_1553644, partial [Mucor lusitanicus]